VYESFFALLCLSSPTSVHVLRWKAPPPTNQHRAAIIIIAGRDVPWSKKGKPSQWHNAREHFAHNFLSIKYDLERPICVFNLSRDLAPEREKIVFPCLPRSSPEKACRRSLVKMNWTRRKASARSSLSSFSLFLPPRLL
jgi:hypothetical protein